ncbi:MAG TPA: iron ABC transporter substrate-binding protein [Segeticoccus sp.]|uniref:iron ABC transporter substrate-binding protein n=1 Tax=Segeticoccus sp. TaxID=2706531 RepID=UPI002D7F4092|nr:iron ABC transporter substrate-binding protein [Segeticoccus sp.]HET8602139.1 iron ABC transporter substrate-binding protein [Segeticoccus sp.]
MSARARLALVATGVAVALTAAGCGGGSSAASGSSSGSDAGSGQPLTLYNAQHEALTQALADGFTKKTGIKVQMRNGEDSEMANQLLQEGKQSPADVFLTENSPSMDLVASKGLLATVNATALQNIPARYVPSDHKWVGFAARSTVLAYNKKLSAADLPHSIMDLAKPKWKGRIGFSPAGADFQAIVSAVLHLKGEQATAQWLKGLKENGKVYDGNTAVMQAVNDGQIDAGIIYHYYWYGDQAESGANSNNVKLEYFGHQDPGAFVSVSGIGVLKSSDQQKEAQEFVDYVTSQAGQQRLADSGTFEYPLNPKAKPNPALKPMSSLDAPKIDPSTLNGPKVISLMQQAGLL